MDFAKNLKRYGCLQSMECLSKDSIYLHFQDINLYLYGFVNLFKNCLSELYSS